MAICNRTAGIIRLSVNCGVTGRVGTRWPPTSRRLKSASRTSRSQGGRLAGRIDELEQEGHALRARIKRLQIAGKTVIAQREQWKSRALAAEELLEAERNRHAGGQDRFDALRRLVAKELHPDFCKGGQLEKLMRQECFKKLWPEIERLAGQR